MKTISIILFAVFATLYLVGSALGANEDPGGGGFYWACINGWAWGYNEFQGWGWRPLGYPC